MFLGPDREQFRSGRFVRQGLKRRQRAHRRGRFGIDPDRLRDIDFQLRFTLKLCILNGLLFAVFIGVFLYFIGINYEMLFQGALQAFI